MKSNDFVIKEDIVTDAHVMHTDHEVQMARADCYNAAKYAIELHKILKQMGESSELEGWVSEKITLANDYLRTVHEYLSYEDQEEELAMPGFDANMAGDAIDRMMESAGGVGASSFAVAMGGPAGNGFGKSVFYKNKKKKIKETAPAAPGQPAPAAGTTPPASGTPAPASGSTASGTPPAGAPGAAAATQPGQSALTGAQTKPAGGTPAAAPAAKAQTPAGGAPGTPPAPAPGQPAPAGAAPAAPGAAPAPGQPPKPGAPAGTATPPNPAQVKKDQDALAAVLNNPAHPVNAELQALIKKAASVPH